MAGEETAKKAVSGGGFKKVVNRKQEIDEATKEPDTTPQPAKKAETPSKRMTMNEANAKLDYLIADTQKRKEREKAAAEAAAKSHMEEEDTVTPEDTKKRGWKYIPGLGNVKVEDDGV